MIDTLTLTAEAAKNLLGAREISGAELFAAYRAAIDERDPELHAYLHVCEGLALEDARTEVKRLRHCVPYMRALEACYGRG